MRSIRWACLFCALTVCALAQEQPKDARIEVQHYAIDADINPRTQSLTATAKVDFTPLDDAAHHAIASCANVWPRFFAIDCNSRT